MSTIADEQDMDGVPNSDVGCAMSGYQLGPFWDMISPKRLTSSRQPLLVNKRRLQINRSRLFGIIMHSFVNMYLFMQF